jgi:hypothetical protein
MKGSGPNRPGGVAGRSGDGHDPAQHLAGSRAGGLVTEPDRWRGCSVCKEPIALGAAYWVCNVSTCNRKRTGLVFCSVDCWDVHLPEARHRESWAIEKTAPRVVETAEAAATPAKKTEKAGGTRRIIPSLPSEPSGSAPAEEVLIVASRLKDYVRGKAGYNTSDRALGPLSDIVRRAVDEAIESARREGRKTVLDRDVPKR